MNKTKLATNGTKSKSSNGKAANSTALIKGLPESEKAELVKDLGILDKSIKAFKITDDVTRGNASLLLTSVKTKIKEVTGKKDSIVKPIKESVKLIEAEFKIILEPLSELETIIKKEIARDYTVQEEIRLETERKAREEEAKKLAKLNEKLNSENQLERSLAENKAEQIRMNTETKIESVAVKTNINTNVGSTNIRKIWTYEVIDPKLVPVEYKVIDSALVNGAIRNGERNIPGLRIFEKPIVAGK